MSVTTVTLPVLRAGGARDKFRIHFGQEIETYKSYQRAIQGLSKHTLSGYNHVLPLFFIYLNKNPDQVIAERQSDITNPDFVEAERYERIVKTYVKDLEKQDMAAVAHLGRIQGFFANNSRRLSLDMRKLKISTESKKKKYSPTQEQRQLLFNVADCARDKFIVAVMCQNGVLPVDLAGLKIGDYPLEPWVYYKKKRSKTGELWHGVSTPEACEQLKAYLRIRKGKLKEPLLLGREGPLSGETIKAIVTLLINRAGLNSIPGFMPKCLRDGFEVSLTEVEVYHKTKEALMGHGKAIDHKYGSEKELEERVLEGMRKTYPLLCLTDKPVSSTVGVTEEVLREIIQMLPALKKIVQNHPAT